LHTSLQVPREARWSRSSAILFSVVLHLALFAALRHMIWRPVEKEGPVFQVFQLDAPPDELRPLHAPPPVVPPVAEVIAPAPATPADDRPTPPPVPAPEAPALVQPNQVPTTLPPPGRSMVMPSLTTAPPGSAAERLQRATIDPGLLSEPSPAAAIPLTPEERATARVYAGIKSYNDSVADAVERAVSATDWTTTDKDGGRWGISPGQIHLGSVTLPLPFYFSPPPGRREELAARLRSFDESNEQARRIGIEQTFQSRVKALRARKDAQRDSARAATGH
jgi:hypothetical protein